MRIMLTLMLILAAQVALAENVKIGVIAPLSGNFASFGEMVKGGIERSKVSGIELIYEDEGCDALKTISAYQKLIQVNKVKLILGPGCGSPQKALAPLLKDKDILTLLYSSAPQEVYTLSGGNMFSVQYSIEEESGFVAEEMFKAGLNSAVIVFAESEYGRSQESGFRKGFRGKIRETFAFSGSEPANVKSIALKLKSLEFDAIFVAEAMPFLLGFRSELMKIGLGSKPVYSVYPTEIPDTLAAEGKGMEGVKYSYPDIGDKSAVGYFPELAARILFEAVGRCGNDASCVKADLFKHHQFDQHGALRAPIILKTVSNGKFVRAN